MWLPSAATSLDDPDEVSAVRGLQRDTTTLVMELTLAKAPSRPEGFVRTSVAAATRAGDEPVPAVQLPDPDDSHLDAWVMVRDGLAVAGAWSVIEGTDCGIYAVGTVPEWRRRGVARDLTRGVLGDAILRGARTATLQSTRIGVPLYRSLGFEPVGRYDEWVPAPT
jgi:ribosomal protein S18 acetylase RimI-like enzyme